MHTCSLIYVLPISTSTCTCTCILYALKREVHVHVHVHTEDRCNFPCPLRLFKNVHVVFTVHEKHVILCSASPASTHRQSKTFGITELLIDHNKSSCVLMYTVSTCMYIQSLNTSYQHPSRVTESTCTCTCSMIFVHIHIHAHVNVQM